MRIRPQFIAAFAITLCAASLPSTAQAQRELHWDSVDVAAHLDAEGRLLVTETQTLVFTGDWNGGERRFNIRPRQTLQLIKLDRAVGDGWKTLTRDSSLDDVDDYAFTDDKTLRWRSRMPGDPPFANTRITYALVYQLANIVLKNGDVYTLDHDFLFPERDGAINHASVVLTFDPAWQPQSPVQSRYTVDQVPPGHGFVLTIPLRYTGTSVPVALDNTLPRGIVRGLWALVALPLIMLAWTFSREQRYGRFAPLETRVDESWIREHIVSQPAEVIAAAWDDRVGSDEVVALLSRLVAEGKLKSTAKKDSLSLSLAIPRHKFEGYERELIDALFLGDRTSTSTDIVRRHYKSTGFNPADVIRDGVRARVAAMLPPGRMPRSVPLLATATYAVGAILCAWEWHSGRIGNGVAALFMIGVLPLILFARQAGLQFRANIQWDARKALPSVLPGLIAIVIGAAYLWRWADRNEYPVSDGYVAGIVMLTLSVLLAGVGALKSTQHRAALAFRKKLASGREFFIAELGKKHPALRDEWFPWVLAFGLGQQMDDWSTGRVNESSSSSSSTGSSSDAFVSGSSASSGGWTGGGGGRSGGAGASAAWGAAAADFAAPIAAPSSSSSSGGGSSSSSSSGGSSGGGGGGGW